MESVHFPVGLRPVGAGEQMLGADLGEGLGEQFGTVGRRGRCRSLPGLSDYHATRTIGRRGS